MIRKLAFSGGTFIESKNELGYEEVLNDFPNAKIIRIVTFNISKNLKDDKLFDLLHSLGEEVDIQIITNIPSRFEWYHSSNAGDFARKTASTNINTYLKKLDPNSFSAKIVPFFNFNNHSKIIGTENKVYIGSANFSNESAANYETGIIIEDKKFIKDLYTLFFEELKNNSIPYFDDDFNQLRLFTLSIFTRLNNHFRYFADKILFLNHKNEYKFTFQETSYSVNDLYELRHDLHELDEIRGLVENLAEKDNELSSAAEEMLTIYNEMPISQLIDLVDIDSKFYEYITFDSEDSFWDTFEEYNVLANEEMLEHYTQIALNEVNDSFIDLCQAVEEDIYSIKEYFELILEKLTSILDIIKENAEHAVNTDIDNT